MDGRTDTQSDCNKPLAGFKDGCAAYCPQAHDRLQELQMYLNLGTANIQVNG